MKVGVPGLEPGKAGPESAVLPITPYPKQKVQPRCPLDYTCKFNDFSVIDQGLSHIFRGRRDFFMENKESNTWNQSTSARGVASFALRHSPQCRDLG